MIENLLTQWKAAPESDDTAIVVPDGCRDLIMKQVQGQAPQWFVSLLYDQAAPVPVKAGSLLMGFRLKPGIGIDEKALLASMPNHAVDLDDIACQLNDFTHRKSSVEESLDCLASDVKSVAHAAQQIGVGQRTLQRLLIRETGRSPVYWMLLARVRRAARATTEATALIEIADIFGYADQAHMNREFKRWLNISPSALRQAPDITRLLHATGYG